MRKQLAKIAGARQTFTGTFVRYGAKPGYRTTFLNTILLKDVTDQESGQVVTDHLWFNDTDGFKAIRPLSGGDVVQFDARVMPYRKGMGKGRRTDWQLSRPTKISKLDKRR